MESLVNFWRGKKVFITGHTGFKGSWLTLWLQRLEAKLTGFALDPATSPNLFTALQLHQGMDDIRGNIQDFSQLKTALTAAQPDIIFHLAAQPLVRYSYQHPVETYATNVMGTVHLLEAARSLPSVRAIVNVTTDKCYENKEWHWGYRENERLGGHDPYSNSKACAELVTSAYRQAFYQPHLPAVGLASARAGNVIGGGDWATDRLVPDLIRACQQQQPLEIRSPHAIRPWQHVLEPLAGYLRLAECLYTEPHLYSEAWNFGPEETDARPVAWLAEHILQLWQSKQQWKINGETSVHEATYLKLDCAKARTKLQWQPRWDLQHALAATVTWYQQFFNGEDPRGISLAQIDEYCA